MGRAHVFPGFVGWVIEGGTCQCFVLQLASACQQAEQACREAFGYRHCSRKLTWAVPVVYSAGIFRLHIAATLCFAFYGGNLCTACVALVVRGSRRVRDHVVSTEHTRVWKLSHAPRYSRNLT